MDFNDFEPQLNDLLSEKTLFNELSDYDVENYFYGLDNPGCASSSCGRPSGSSSSDSSPPLSCDNYSTSESEPWETTNGFNDYNFLQPEFTNDFNSDFSLSDSVKIESPSPSQKSYMISNDNKNMINVKTLIPVTPKQTVKVIKIENYQPLHVSCDTKQVQPSKLVPIAPSASIQKEDLKLSTEQCRKIKNRMYAQASRQRKKNEEILMKTRLEELEKENEKLRTENIILRRKLSQYEKIPEITISSNNGSRPVKRKLVAAGSVLMAFGLLTVLSPITLNNISKTYTSNENGLIQTMSPGISRHGRVLSELSDEPSYVNEIHVNDTNGCGSHKLNASEAMRVTNDIDQWVREHSFNDFQPVKFHSGLVNKKAMMRFNKNEKIEKVILPKTSQEDEPRPMEKSQQARIRSVERTWKQLDLLRSESLLRKNEEKVMKRKNVDKLSSIIRQKSDTLYIMALEDYVLLPALKRSSTNVPKLSIILPSAPINGTLMDEYSLLRVECEVTGTGQFTLSTKQLAYLIP